MVTSSFLKAKDIWCGCYWLINKINFQGKAFHPSSVSSSTETHTQTQAGLHSDTHMWVMPLTLMRHSLLSALDPKQKITPFLNPKLEMMHQFVQHWWFHVALAGFGLMKSSDVRRTLLIQMGNICWRQSDGKPISWTQNMALLITIKL